jgi:hypothetical protein
MGNSTSPFASMMNGARLSVASPDIVASAGNDGNYDIEESINALH